MIIKKAKFKKVKEIVNRCISDDVYGCDECKKEIKECPNEDSRLVVTVFHKGDHSSDALHFCSWDCVLKHIPKIKTDYFIDLPFLYFDERPESKRHGNEFIRLTKSPTNKHKKT